MFFLNKMLQNNVSKYQKNLPITAVCIILYETLESLSMNQDRLVRFGSSATKQMGLDQRPSKPTKTRSWVFDAASRQRRMLEMLL